MDADERLPEIGAGLRVVPEDEARPPGRSEEADLAPKQDSLAAW